MAIVGIRAVRMLAAGMLLAALPAAVAAQAVTEDQVIADLKGDGFTVIESGTTLLGRIRITAAGPEGTREVVLNPRNGKVLRDIIIEEKPRAAATVPVAPAPVALAPAAPVTAAARKPVAVATPTPVTAEGETEAEQVAAEAARVVTEAPRDLPRDLPRDQDDVTPAPSVAEVGRSLASPVVTESLPDPAEAEAPSAPPTEEAAPSAEPERRSE